MTQDEINAMAKEAGARSENWATRLFPAVQFLFTPDELSRFAALVEAKEREAWRASLEPAFRGRMGSEQVREIVQSAIRSRGQKGGV